MTPSEFSSLSVIFYMPYRPVIPKLKSGLILTRMNTAYPQISIRIFQERT